MKIPDVIPRRPYDEEAFGDGYMESDRDFTENNMAACIWFLENRHQLMLKKQPSKPAMELSEDEREILNGRRL